MVKNTKLLADKIVDALSNRLQNIELPSIKSIYVCGSYCRGDWLNCSSDLDIHMIINDSGADLEYIKSIVDDDFPSHCPGGVEYGVSHISHIPKTYQDACKPSPYAYFSTLMFDLKENNITLYGDNINDLLPVTPDPKVYARDWFHMLSGRLNDDERLPFGVYKMIIAAQLHFGEKTVNKYKMLELYQKYIPEFSMKWFGELVIRNYIGSIYPDRVPACFSYAEYRSFVDELSKLF
ncbi:MAG: hypothetical protein FWF15_11980 [Oscillospiraceae bacterium]|nr:hypothetical protein [Oscillospiraceae bacterium]